MYLYNYYTCIIYICYALLCVNTILFTGSVRLPWRQAFDQAIVNKLTSVVNTRNTLYKNLMGYCILTNMPVVVDMNILYYYFVGLYDIQTQ